MEHYNIVKLNSLEAIYAKQTSALLVDSFYTMFQGISKDREVLRRLFLPCMQLDLIYVLLIDGRVAGFLAVPDCKKRAIVIRREECISVFGTVKGSIIAWQLHKILSTPAVKDSRSGYIDFIATAPEFQRCKVATNLLSYVEKDTDFTRLYLDVLVSNHPAICLYEKLGYHIDMVKKNIWMRLAGIKAMNIMIKELKS